jgi:hypothetical protein
VETQGRVAAEAEVASSSFWSIPVEISQGRVPGTSVHHAVKFQFRCKEAQFGDRLLVMGDWLDWQEHDALELKCTHFPEWVAEAAVPSGVHEFKLMLLKANSERKWETIDDNRTIEVAHSCTVGGTFGTVVQTLDKVRLLATESHASVAGLLHGDTATARNVGVLSVPSQ